MSFTLGEWNPVTGAENVQVATANPAEVNLGLVIGSEGAVVIDTGSSPEQGRDLLRSAGQSDKEDPSQTEREGPPAPEGAFPRPEPAGNRPDVPAPPCHGWAAMSVSDQSQSSLNLTSSSQSS